MRGLPRDWEVGWTGAMTLQKPSQKDFGKPTDSGDMKVAILSPTRTPDVPVSLYGGAVLLRFHKKRHRYEITENGETHEVPSVTRILRIVDKSEPLTQWAANCAAELLAEQLRPGQALDEIQIAELCAVIRFAHRGVSGRAKGIGKLAHGWVEELLRRRIAGEPGEPLLPVNEQARRTCLAARDWLAKHHFEPLAAEQMIYSRAHGYAGTLDFHATAKIDGRFSIVDWKTSAAIYPEYRLQLAAYAEALWEMNARPMPDRWIVRLGKDDGTFEAVRLPHEEQDADFRAFLGAKILFERVTEIKQAARDNETLERIERQRLSQAGAP